MRTQNRDRLSIKPGIPVTITLAKDVPGRETRGNHGEIDYMYVIHGEAGSEAVMFLPPHAAASMDESKGRAGDTFEIHRSKGDKYEIIHIEDEPEEPRPRQTAPPSGPPREYVHRQPQPEQQRLVSQTRNQRPALPAAEDEKLTQQLAASLSQTSTASYYSRYLTAAVDALKIAVMYAKEQGILLSPTFEDVRCIAATLFIEHQKNGSN